MPEGAAYAATPRARAGSASACVLVLWVGHRPGPVDVPLAASEGATGSARAPGRRHRRPRAGPHAPAAVPLAHRRLRTPSWSSSRPTCRERGVDAVLPLDEDIVRLLAERAPDLGGAVVAGPDAAQYRALCDKGELARTARRAGVDHPCTIEVAGEPPADGWPELPCIVKPRISGSSGLWEKPMLATTARERDDAVARAGGRGHPGAGAGAGGGTAVRRPLRALGPRLRLPRLPGGPRLPARGRPGLGDAHGRRPARGDRRDPPAAGPGGLPGPVQPELHRARRALHGARRQPAPGRDRGGLDPRRLRHPRPLRGGRPGQAEPAAAAAGADALRALRRRDQGARARRARARRRRVRGHPGPLDRARAWSRGGRCSTPRRSTPRGC